VWDSTGQCCSRIKLQTKEEKWYLIRTRAHNWWQSKGVPVEPAVLPSIYWNVEYFHPVSHAGILCGLTTSQGYYDVKKKTKMCRLYRRTKKTFYQRCYILVRINHDSLIIKHLQNFGSPKRHWHWKFANPAKYLTKICLMCSKQYCFWFFKWIDTHLAPSHFLEPWWKNPLLPEGIFRCLWVNIKSVTLNAQKHLLASKVYVRLNVSRNDLLVAPNGCQSIF